MLVDHVGEVEIVLPAVVAEVIAEHSQLGPRVGEMRFERSDATMRIGQVVGDSASAQASERHPEQFAISGPMAADVDALFFSVIPRV